MTNINAFSIDAPECVACENYGVCKSKRKALCAYACNKPIAPQTAADLTLHVAIDLEDVKKELERSLYKSLSCSFGGGA